MKSIKKRSKLQEEKIAKEIKGKTVVASGALWGAKGDVRNDKYLVEAKYTDKKCYTLKAQTWTKIRNEAVKDGVRIPVMQIQIQGNNYAVMDLKDYTNLIGDRSNDRFINEEGRISFRLQSNTLAKYDTITVKLLDLFNLNAIHILVIFQWEKFLEVL